ncbi:ERMAP protein, partial [Cisticola juncidis]|nr:ERMAP protein [Cisticola juncidis]
TLDPDTAHPRLALSPDGRSVSWGDTRRAVPDHPKRFDSSRCVLGTEGFSSGRHYWEVWVARGATWAVGVAKESVPRKGRVSIKPEGGIWAVGQCGGQCQALTCPAVPIRLPQAPEVVGVYLDYEEGRGAFFDGRRGVPMFAYPPA